MQFVNNLNNLTVDDQYFMEVPVQQGPSNVPTGNIGLVGTFSRGPLNTPTLVTSYPDLVKKFGEVDQNFSLTGPITARGIFKQGNTNVYVVRISSSTNPATYAKVYLYDSNNNLVMILQAATPGSWGDALTATVSNGTKPGTFKISLQYGSESETWDNLVIAQPATPIAGAVLVSTIFGPNGQSQLATATFPSTPNINAPANGTYAFTGGTDGADASPADYIGSNMNGVKTGLYALDNAPVNLVLCAEQSDPSVNQALAQNAQSITQNGGLPRDAVITFPKGTPVANLASLMSQFDTDRVFPCYLWQQIYDPVTNSNQVVSPLGFFAGLLAQLSPHLSPGNKPIFGTLGVDPNMNIGPSDLATMAQARVNAVGVPTPAGPLGVRGGFTASQTAGDPQQIYVRRMKDYIDQLVYTIGGQFVDQPITPDLMRQVYQSVDNILYPMKNPASPSDQMIADYKITCDNTNNPPSSTGQNRLICDYAVKLLNMNRFMIFRTQIGAGVVITSTHQGQ
ncbi:tail protein [Collibacillus ludicampi]|uniref:Tail protein n=1 Tax=Collibacillus ludicampi TaxID=2771369 RepID=A0AAV4LHB2_9BACL|nr:hypothetical protein [Collibacillus ludicampi]GIM47038.1 tail protein [Collibacillus ludicampi]